MGFFDHQHRWFEKTGLNTIVNPETKQKVGGLIIEECRCGAIRQVEFSPGEAPVVRMAEHP